MDLIIADYSNGFRFPGVLDPPPQIPPWNANIPSFLNILMAFALTYLYDDGAFILFYHDNFAVKK